MIMGPLVLEEASLALLLTLYEGIPEGSDMLVPDVGSRLPLLPAVVLLLAF
jgi:hypothetical protein